MSMLEVEGVSKAFVGIRALDVCSLSVEEGTIAGLIGPNGSGKTTLFNVITGYERAGCGAVRFRGAPITNAGPERIFGQGSGRTFQLTRIFPRLTVIEKRRHLPGGRAQYGVRDAAVRYRDPDAPGRRHRRGRPG